MILQNSAEILYRKQILHYGYQKIEHEMENQTILFLSSPDNVSDM